MKKFYLLGTLLVSIIIAAMAATTETPVYDWTTGSQTVGTTLSDTDWSKKTFTGVVSFNKHYAGALAIQSMNNTDAWLFSPGFKAKKGAKYQLSCKWKQFLSPEFTLKIYLCDGSSISANTAEEAVTAAGTNFKEFSQTDLPNAFAPDNTKIEFVAPADGQSYIALHMVGSNVSFQMKDVTITEITEEETEEPGQTEEPEHDCKGASVPYTTLIAESENNFIEGWSQINVNASTQAWKPYSLKNAPNGASFGATISYDGSYPKEDYLISPLIHLEEGTKYGVIFDWQTDSYGESLEVFLSKGNTVQTFTDKIEVINIDNEKSTSWAKKTGLANIEETGDYHLVFHATSPANRFRINIDGFTIQEYKFSPSPVSDLKATPGEHRSLSCKLTWKFTTTDNYGESYPENSTYSIDIYRDEETAPIKSFSGSATEFTDSKETGLTSGTHKYSVVVTVNGTQSEKATIETPFIGTCEPYEITEFPYILTNFTKDELVNWEIGYGVKNNQSSLYENWHIANENRLYVESTSYYEWNSYISSPGLKFTEPGYYTINVQGRKAQNEPSTFKVYFGTSPDYTQMEFQTAPEFDLTYSTSEFKSHKTDVYVPEAGVYYFAVEAYASRKANSYIINAFEINKSQYYPGVVTDIQATPIGQENKVKVTWANPIVDFAGQPMAPDAQYKVEIYLDDAETPVATIEYKSTETELEVPEADFYTITIKTVSDKGETAPEAPSVRTFIGSRFEDLTYSTNFNSSDKSLKKWTTVDGNDNSTEFSYYVKEEEGKETVYVYRLSGPTTGLQSFNDYMLSPYFDLEPGEYKVTVAQRGGPTSGTTKTIKPTLGIAAAGTFTADHLVLAKQAPTYNVTGGNSSSDSNVETVWSFTINENEGGAYQIVYGLKQTFYISNKLFDNEYLFFDSFELEKIVPYAADVTDLKAEVVTEEENSSVKLTWTNPTTEFNSEDALSEFGIVIERDGEVLENIEQKAAADQVTAYTDTDIEESFRGTHTYVVRTTINGKSHKGEYPSVTTAWIGEAYTAPVDCANGEFENWTTADGGTAKKVDRDKVYYAWHNDGSQWFIQPEPMTEHTVDDYLISAPLKVEKNVVYQVTFKCGHHENSGQAVTAAVKMGTGTDHTEFTKVHEIVVKSDEEEAVEHTFYVAVASEDDPKAEAPAKFKAESADDEPATEPENPAKQLTAQELYEQAAKVPAGDHRIALHLSNAYDAMYVHEFHYTEVVRDGVLTTGLGTIEAGKVEFDGGALHFAGVADVEVYNLAGACVGAAKGVEGAYSFEGFAAGYYIVKVATAAETVTVKVAVK